MRDVSNINTLMELTGMVNEITPKVTGATLYGIDPDKAKTFTNRMNEIQTRMADLVKRQEGEVERIARDAAKLEDEVDHAPKDKNRS